MDIYNLFEQGVINQVDAPAQITADTNGAWFDTKDYTGKGIFLVASHDSNGSGSPTLQAVVQDSDTNGSSDGGTPETGVVDGTFTAQTTGDAIEGVGIDLDACKRYVRIQYQTGGTPVYVVGSALIGAKKDMP